MLPTVITAIFALAAPEDRRPTIHDYIAEVCAAVPDEACDRLTGFVAALNRLTTRGAVDAGTWCCRSCGAGGTGGPKIACDGCVDPGIWKCGSFRHSKRPVHADCPGVTTFDDGVVNCY